MHLTVGGLVFLSNALLAAAQANASATVQIASSMTGTSSPANPNLGSEQGPWVVSVGSDSGALVFSPSTITANAGDEVQFVFYGRNHSLADSSFDDPCVPTNKIFSGFMPAKDGNPTWTINVKTADPIWLFCSQGDHCEAGMVAVINPPQSGPQTLSAYAAKAAKVASRASAGNASQPLGPSSNVTSPSRTSSPAVAQSTKASTLTMNRVPTGLIGVALLFWVLL